MDPDPGPEHEIIRITPYYFVVRNWIRIRPKIKQIPIFFLFFSVKGLKKNYILLVCEFITIFLYYPNPDQPFLKWIRIRNTDQYNPLLHNHWIHATHPYRFATRTLSSIMSSITHSLQKNKSNTTFRKRSGIS